MKAGDLKAIEDVELQHQAEEDIKDAKAIFTAATGCPTCGTPCTKKDHDTIIKILLDHGGNVNSRAK